MRQRGCRWRVTRHAMLVDAVSRRRLLLSRVIDAAALMLPYATRVYCRRWRLLPLSFLPPSTAVAMLPCRHADVAVAADDYALDTLCTAAEVMRGSRVRARSVWCAAAHAMDVGYQIIHGSGTNNVRRHIRFHFRD